MKQLFRSLPFKLAVGVGIGILFGLLPFAEVYMEVVVTLKYVMNQIILFCVPLIIIGFIAPSITKLGSHASKLLGVAVGSAYISSVGAAFFAMLAGFALIPRLSIVSEMEGLKELPELVFRLDIPQIMPVMSALVFSILVGLAAAWTKAETVTKLLEEFQEIVLSVVTKPDSAVLDRVLLLRAGV